jgi:MFS superfamily sulfate permease-like transporter
MRFTRHEVAGAFADLGTLLPLALSLVVVNGLHPTPVLLIPGLLYLWCAWFYRLPMPVQPLKAFSALAIGMGLAPSVISAGALLMGLCLLLLGATSLGDRLTRLFTVPIIRGIQVGIGLILLWSAGRMILAPAPGGLRLSSWIIAGIALALLLLLWRSTRLPAGLAVLGFGVGLGLLAGPTFSWNLGPGPLQFALPSGADALLALQVLVIPQLPLTFANSVVACTDAARRYFGDGSARVRPRPLLLDMGAANIAAGMLGGMPVCHGAGGMTAHVKFGARTGAAPVIIGGTLVTLALGFGHAAVPLLQVIPRPVLGVLLGVIGVQHALLAADQRGFDLVLALVMGAVALATGNIAICLVVGLLAEAIRRSVRLARRDPARPSLPLPTLDTERLPS